MDSPIHGRPTFEILFVLVVVLVLACPAVVSFTKADPRLLQEWVFENEDENDDEDEWESNAGNDQNQKTMDSPSRALTGTVRMY